MLRGAKRQDYIQAAEWLGKGTAFVAGVYFILWLGAHLWNIFAPIIAAASPALLGMLMVAAVLAGLYLLMVWVAKDNRELEEHRAARARHYGAKPRPESLQNLQ